MKNKSLIYCALDTADLNQAIEWAKAIGPVTGGLKLGMEFFNTFGPQGVEKVRNACPDADLFIDLKFHDIPNTVAAAVRTISTNLAPAYLNVHAQGGVAMMEAAAKTCAKQTKLLAVTVLTSLDNDAIKTMGMLLPVHELVNKLAYLSKEAGLHGVVCSAHDIKPIRRDCGQDFILMVPGIRPAGADVADQKRVMTPKEAIHEGASHIVIGRPITGEKDPAAAAHEILKTIEQK